MGGTPRIPPKEELRQAIRHLDECTRLVERLHTMCCEPDRSPRMQAILADLDATRQRIDSLPGPDEAAEIVAALEAIGAQVGHLQVACCTAARMPVYAETLSGLAATRIALSRSIGQGH